MTALAATHGSNADVLVNGLVMSQYFSEFSNAATRDKAETSAFKQQWKSYVAGLGDNVMSFGGLYDASNSTAEDAVLSAQMYAVTAVDNTWFYCPTGAQGSSAAGAVGYSVTGISTKYEIKSSLQSANSITAEVQMDQGGGGLDRGFVYSPWVTQGAGGNSNSINNGAASSNGGVLIVHASSDTASLVVNLQDSADNSTWANVTGYTVSPVNATAAAYRYPAANVVPGQLTIRQYTRITWTGTGTFLAFFSRK